MKTTFLAREKGTFGPDKLASMFDSPLVETNRREEGIVGVSDCS